MKRTTEIGIGFYDRFSTLMPSLGSLSGIIKDLGMTLEEFKNW